MSGERVLRRGDFSCQCLEVEMYLEHRNSREAKVAGADASLGAAEVREITGAKLSTTRYGMGEKKGIKDNNKF